MSAPEIDQAPLVFRGGLLADGMFKVGRTLVPSELAWLFATHGRCAPRSLVVDGEGFELLLIGSDTMRRLRTADRVEAMPHLEARRVSLAWGVVREGVIDFELDSDLKIGGALVFAPDSVNRMRRHVMTLDLDQGQCVYMLVARPHRISPLVVA